MEILNKDTLCEKIDLYVFLADDVYVNSKYTYSRNLWQLIKLHYNFPPLRNVTLILFFGMIFFSPVLKK